MICICGKKEKFSRLRGPPQGEKTDSVTSVNRREKPLSVLKVEERHEAIILNEMIEKYLGRIIRGDVGRNHDPRSPLRIEKVQDGF
jgi:hypothetical protein